MPELSPDVGFDAKYFIDGFRSLKEFEITLTPGLNILVGPNGSGKTNFIDFLDFLSVLIVSGAANAVSHVGGIGRVFGQQKNRRAYLMLNAKVCGSAEIPENAHPDDVGKIFRFHYEIEMRFHKPSSTLFISRESIKFFKLSTKLDNDKIKSQSVGVLSLTRQSGQEDGLPNWHIGPRLLADNQRNPLAARRRFSNPKIKQKIFENHDSVEVMPDESILFYPGLVAFTAIRNAINRGRSINIAPEKVRIPDDITRPPGISRDGSGLATTLYHLQAITRSNTNKYRYKLRLATPESFGQVLEWTRLVFRDLEDLGVVQDAHTGKYIGNFTVGDRDQLKLPFQAASDGTLKWLSLVTLIITSGGAVSLEEPENFLHPKMQQFLVELIRQSIPDSPGLNYAVISTHSETLISQCDAKELVIFNFSDNKTKCSRVKNPEKVREEINKTGFGLGYFYANNSIS